MNRSCYSKLQQVIDELINAAIKLPTICAEKKNASKVIIL